METLQILVLVYAALVFVNIIITGGLWYLTRYKVYFYMMIQWIAAMATWLVQGKTVTGTDFVRVSGFAIPVFFAHLALGRTLEAFADFKVNRIRLFVILSVGYAFTVALHLLGFNGVIMGLPVMAGCIGPAIESSVRTMALPRERTTLTVKAMALSIFLFGMYNFGFITSFIAPHTMVYGFGFSIILVIMIATLGPVAAFEISTKEKALAEAESKYRDSLVHSAKMKALGEMAGGIAHEINNPLAILVAQHERMLDILTEERVKPEELRDITVKNLGTLDRIKKIVMGLRSFARDGSRDPFEKVNVQEIIENTLSFCSERFKSKDVEVSVVNPDPDLKFEVRPTEVSQVLLNLLNNAFDEVLKTETKRWVRIHVVKKMDQVEIRVIDSGGGIPQELAPKIFQPFFTTKDIGKGTGLGLSISLGLVRAQNGSLFLDSEEHNTTFVVSLPIQQQKMAAVA